MNASAMSFKQIKAVLIPLVDSLVSSSSYKPEAQHAARQWCQLWISHYDLAVEDFLRGLHLHLMRGMVADSEDDL
jgi:hypothetical protein